MTSIDPIRLAVRVQRKINTLEERGYLLHSVFPVDGGVLFVMESEEIA